MLFNSKNTKLPFDDFNFGGRSYIRVIDDLDNRNKNGYGLIGSFVAKNEDTQLKEDKLYLSCSRGGEKDVYHLFTIKNDEPKLIKTSMAQKGAVRSLWGAMEDFLSKREKKTPQQLFNIITEIEPNREALVEFGLFLIGECSK